MFDGTESGFSAYNLGKGFYISLPDMITGTYTAGYCSHFVNDYKLDVGMFLGSANKYLYVKGLFNEAQSNINNATQLWLAAQYAAGTPVTVFYKLAEPVIESVDPIALPTYPRSTNLTCNATITASVRVVDQARISNIKE